MSTLVSAGATLPYRIHIVGGCHVAADGYATEDQSLPAYLRETLQNYLQVEIQCSPKSRIACAHFHLKRMNGRPNAIILQLGHDESLHPLPWKRVNTEEVREVSKRPNRMTLQHLLLRGKAKGLLAWMYACGLAMTGRRHFDPKAMQAKIETTFGKISRDFPGIPVYVLSTFPLAHPYRMHIRRIINRALREQSEKHRWTYIDVCFRMSTWNWCLFIDEVHLSPKGNQIIAEAISAAFLRRKKLPSAITPLQKINVLKKGFLWKWRAGFLSFLHHSTSTHGS